MSDQKTPLPGEWWETRSGKRVTILDWGPPQLVVQSRIGVKPSYFFGYQHINEVELTRHLPGCTGWDWEEPNND